MDYQFKEMEYEEDLFQKIINREFPTEIIFEDDSVFAFEWINPVAPTHILIIPKKKIETLNDITDEDSLIVGKMVIVAKKIAIEQRVSAKQLSKDENKNPFCLPQILINLDAIGAPIAMPIIINVIGKVANESFTIIFEVIIPPLIATARMAQALNRFNAYRW